MLNRRKLGFPVPIRHWLKDEMYDWARDIIVGRGTEYLIDRAAVLRMLDDAPGRAARLLPQDVDAAGVHDLARHLRRAADHPGDPASRSTRSRL